MTDSQACSLSSQCFAQSKYQPIVMASSGPPEPVVQDKAAFHLLGHPLPALIELASTAGGAVDLFLLSLSRPVMLFVYPRTGVPGQPSPPDWDSLPGAKGCTPHLCGVRDSLSKLKEVEPELEIFGLSTQAPDEQKEAASRLELPFPLLSDSELQLTKALEIPTLPTKDGSTFLRRMTLLLRGGQITRVDYPILRPEEAAHQALHLLIPEEVLAAQVDARDAAEAAAKANAAQADT